MSLTVCGLIGSPFYRKICTLLNEKDVPYETETMNPFQAGEEFSKLNPMRRIPLLKDTDAGADFILPDSSAITQYIERKHPTPAMLPDDLTEYGRALWFEEYADTEMAGIIGLKVFRTVVFPQLAGKEPDFSIALQTIREKLPRIHDYLEEQLEGKEWLAGNMFSVADISVAVQYSNLAFTGYSPSVERWPNLAAYMRRIGERNSFTALHIKGAETFTKMKKIELDPAETL